MLYPDLGKPYLWPDVAPFGEFWNPTITNLFLTLFTLAYFFFHPSPRTSLSLIYQHNYRKAIRIYTFLEGMGTIVAALGLAATGFFVYPTIKDLIPNHDVDATIIKIQLGTMGIHGKDDLMGGNTPNIQLWTEAGNLIGSASGGAIIASGGSATIKVLPNKGMKGTQASYIAVSAGGNDAICISSISVAWPDGSDALVWLGDLGRACVSDWSPSVSRTGSGGEQSSCVWIDGDYSNGLKYQGLGLHMTDFDAISNVATAFNDNIDLLCNAPARQKFYPQLRKDDWTLYFQPPLQYTADNTDVDPTKVIGQGVDLNPELIQPAIRQALARRTYELERREAQPRIREDFAYLNETLIHSHFPWHSAEALCKSKGAVSPDFVSHVEGMFCDMKTRQLWPLCNNSTTPSTCFDITTNTLNKSTTSSNITKGDVIGNTKTYGGVVTWQ